MPDYSKGKIYKLWSLDNLDMVYIGSTCQPLHKRLYEHKKKWGLWKKGFQYYNSCDMFENCEEVKIELIEECPCDNRNQLLRTEGGYIREMDCINKRVAGRTKKEWRETHKEHHKQYHKQYQQINKQAIAQQRKQYRQDNREKIKKCNKQYREANREKIKARRSIKITCECGSIVSKNAIAIHRRTKKHERFINNK